MATPLLTVMPAAAVIVSAELSVWKWRRNGAVQSGAEFSNRVVRFFLVQQTNVARIYTMAIKYTKGSLNLQTFFIPRPSKIDPYCYFWYPKPGNPV
jgi:hypothetical protein